jgi:hypothetical protein
MQQRRLQQIQQTLGSTDDEFAALSPKITAILALQNDVNPQGGRGGGRRGGGGGGGGGIAGPAPTQNPDGSPLSPVQAARADLQNTLQDQNATPDLIKTKLEAYRAAVDKAKSDLAAAQKDLIAVLTQKQEAQLVLLSVLN